jgi:hypothetical protein
MKYLMVLAPVLAITLAAVGCSDDDDSGSDGDASAGQIGSLSENATYAWIEDGPAGLYDYLSEEVTTQCTQEQVEKALAATTPEVTGWRQIDDIEQAGNEATATVIVIVEGEDTEQPWEFVREGDSWRISSVPGLEECRA